MDLHTFIQSGSYIAIFLLMIANGIISFPSSQILYIVVGYFVGTGSIGLIPAILAGALGNTIGNIVLYMITVRYGEQAAQKFLPIDAKIISAIKKTFTDKGLWWLALAKLIPSLKVAVPVLAGLAKTPLRFLTPILLVTSTIWATGFIMIGKILGEHFSFGKYAIIIAAVGLIVFTILYKAISKNIEK